MASHDKDAGGAPLLGPNDGVPDATGEGAYFTLSGHGRRVRWWGASFISTATAT